MGMYLVAIHQLDQASFFLCLVLSLGVVAPIKNFTNYVNQLKSIQYAISEVQTILDLEELSQPEQFQQPKIPILRLMMSVFLIQVKVKTLF